MISPTRRERELLDFLTAEQRKGIAPSLEEMARHMRLASKSGAHRLLSGLESKGLIRRLQRRARAIEVMPDDRLLCPHCGFHAGSPACVAAARSMTRIPVYGAVPSDTAARTGGIGAPVSRA